MDKPHVEPYMDAVDYTYGYRVSKNVGLVGMAYTVDFAQDTVRNMGKILSQYDRNIWVIGGTYSNMKSGYWSDWRRPTHAWMSADLQSFGGYGSSFGWMKFYVNGQSYWIDWQ
ncbi:MAG: hypothetical protein Q4E37_02795 [Tissierellia bacterium]|nr:hypothetical protein [Tissierellia bacterium]